MGMRQILEHVQDGGADVKFYHENQDGDFVSFDGHIMDAEGDPIQINGYYEDVTIEVEGLNYVVMSPTTLKILQRLLKTADRLQKDLSASPSLNHSL